MYTEPFSEKQKEFIINANAKFNIAHGSVRSGKTVAVTWRFLQEVLICPGNQIWLIGYTQDSIYQNVIRLIMDEASDKFSPFFKLSTWMPGRRELRLAGKSIFCLGASDESSIGQIQGKTFDLCYCNEMTLYPSNLIQMISTRLSMPHSRLYADMNPVHPSHICKKWVDLAEEGDKNYFQIHFTIDDNPYLTDDFKKMLRQTLSGLFLKRNYYGEWCLAEGAIFDFLDRDIHTIERPPCAADFWLSGVDYGTNNAFAAVLVGVSTGMRGQPAVAWVEKEYYYDYTVTGRQKSPSEFAEDLERFLGDTPLRALYVDPSAAAFRQELHRKGIHTSDADNDVFEGVMLLTNLVKNGQLFIGKHCTNLIREMELYSWDPKKAKLGRDEPIKQNDHAIDALRYAMKSYMGQRTTLKAQPSDNFNLNRGMQWRGF